MKKLNLKMEKSSWKSNMIIAIITVLLLILIAFIGNNVTGKFPSLSFILIPLWALWAFICLYKFITFGKTYKWYRVVKDTNNSHGMVNTYCKHRWYTGEGRLGVKDTKTGKFYLLDEKDVVEATAEYITKKFEQAALFFAGVIALVILGSNVINGGHWFGTIGFAIISFVCFTIYRIQKDEY